MRREAAASHPTAWSKFFRALTDRAEIALKMWTFRGVLFVIVAIAGGHGAVASTLKYSTNLLDAPTNTWVNTYSLNSSTNFGTGNPNVPAGFTVYFDSGMYSSIDNFPLAPNSDWFVFTVQPDSFLPADGSFVAQAFVPVFVSALPQEFQVTFVYFNLETPGPQRFEVFDTNFLILQSGRTTPSGSQPVPEPHAALMVLTSLLLLKTTRWSFPPKSSRSRQAP